MKFRKETNINGTEGSESGNSEAKSAMLSKFGNGKKLTPFRIAVTVLLVIIALLAVKRILFSKEKSGMITYRTKSLILS